MIVMWGVYFAAQLNMGLVKEEDEMPVHYTRWTKKKSPPYDFCWYYSNAWEFLHKILHDC